MFLLRAKNTYGEDKKKVYQVKRYPCLYVSSVEMFTDLNEDVSVLKKTVDRTVSNLNLKALTGEPVQLVLNENGIIIQENKFKDNQANSVLMAHALKRICYTTSYHKKRIYVFVSRLPQEERVFAHFFLMQDKSSGDKIIKELSNLFTNAFKAKKRKTLEKDKRRNLRAQHPVAAPAPQPQKPVKVPASPKKAKNKSNPPPLNQFAPPPPYVDVTANQDALFQEFDIISPLNTPSAPPFSPEQTPARNNFAGAEAFPPGYGYLPQVPTFDTPPQQATAAYLNDPFLPQPEQPRYIEAPFAPQRANLNLIDVQDPFSAFQFFPQSNNVSSSALEASDGLPSYNSYSREFQTEPIVSRDDMLIDLTSPEHRPTTRLMRSLSTSNVLDEVRSDSPPFLPPAYIAPDSPEVPLPPSEPQQASAPAFRCRIGVQNGSPARPKSGIYPSLSSGLERQRTPMLPFAADDFEPSAISYKDEHFELVNEPWYQEGLPRDIIIELLRDQKEGAFFIRESLSQPGKLALSVKASTAVVHFLIIKSNKGYHVESDKIFFPSISLLVMHHSINRGVLPCTLTVADSNPAYLRADHLESSDSEAEGEDPVYTTYALTNSMNIHQH